MHLLLVILTFILVSATGLHADKGTSVAGRNFIQLNTPRQTDDLIADLVFQTNMDTLLQYIRVLSGEDSAIINGIPTLIQSRDASHPQNDIAADYIFQTLNRYGLPTENQYYGSSGRNVYSVKTGTTYPDQQFIICAHYDSRPYLPGPGADDNASGTAVVLETARILSELPTPFTIIFALWDEEEIGLVGSRFFAEQASIAGEDILGVINLDMLGWDGNDDGRFDLHSRQVANSEALADLVIILEDQYVVDLIPEQQNPGTTASDHASFWDEGYGAVLLIENYYGGDFNPFYHSSNDRVNQFNLDYFYALSRLAVATISHLAFNSTVVSSDRETTTPPTTYELAQNYPNPFNASTVIAYQLSDDSEVRLTVYDMLGRVVKTLVNASQRTGRYEMSWDGRDEMGVAMASGFYLCRMTAGHYHKTRKMVLIR